MGDKLSSLSAGKTPSLPNELMRASQLLHDQSLALQTLASSLDLESLTRAIDCLANNPGRIVCTGMGKSGHIARKAASTLSSTGSPAIFIHPAEARHGDLGMMVPGDAVLAFSKSGHSVEVSTVQERAINIGAPFVLVSENDDDGLAFNADVVLTIPKLPESWYKAPTTSALLQLAMADVIATLLTERNRDFEPVDFHLLHPGGAIPKG